jgi:hypothetical protein
MFDFKNYGEKVVCPYCGHENDPNDADYAFYHIPEGDEKADYCDECDRMFVFRVEYVMKFETAPYGYFQWRELEIFMMKHVDLKWLQGKSPERYILNG